MVLVYLPTKLGHKNGINVSKYTSTMDHLGWLVIDFLHPVEFSRYSDILRQLLGENLSLTIQLENGDNLT